MILKARQKKSSTMKKKKIYSNELINDNDSLYDKSDYEKTLRCGSIYEPDNLVDSSKNDKKSKKNNDNIINDIFKSKSFKKVRKKEEEKKNNNDNIRNLSQNKKNNIDYTNNPNFIPKNKVKKYLEKINNLQKQSKGSHQLLFCCRVAIENALDVCTTISSCYKWIGENYLKSQIKKVIKEAKLKEKQKQDKEKYGNIGNVPKKVNPAKKKIFVHLTKVLNYY